MSDTKVKVADEKELEVWDKIVDLSEMGTVFHKLDWLRAAEKHTRSKLYPLIGYEGREVVGLFPIFYKKRAFVNGIFATSKMRNSVHGSGLQIPQQQTE